MRLPLVQGASTMAALPCQAWYYAHVYGRPQDGNTVPLNASGSVTSCATTPGAVWYYEPSPKAVRKAAA